MKLKTILEAYRSGERGLPTYAELVEIDAALRAQADAGPVAWRVTGHWKDGGEAGPFFYTEERLADMHLEHLASGVSVPLYILPAPEAAQALREAISICQQEGDEWDSDNVQLTKNYAHACRDRIAQLLTRASAATEPQGLSERVEELRKALFESRDAMRVMSNWVKKTDPAGHRWAVHMVDMANNVLAGAATVAEPSEQRLYTLDQMREYVEASTKLEHA